MEKYNLSSLKEGEITKAKLGRVGMTMDSLDRAIGGAKLPISITSSVNKVVKLNNQPIVNK